jgi:hypothetical protein
MILYDIIWYYMILYGIIWNYMISYDIMIYCSYIDIYYIYRYVSSWYSSINHNSSCLQSLTNRIHWPFPSFYLSTKTSKQWNLGFAEANHQVLDQLISGRMDLSNTYQPSTIIQWWLFIFLDSWFQWIVLGPPQQPSFLNEKSITFGCLTHQHTHLVSFHAKLAPILLATLWYFNTLQSGTSPFLVRYIIEQVSLAMTSSSQAASHWGYIPRFSRW